MEQLISSFAEYLFSLLCHQNPSLLLNIYGGELHLCTRCGWLYIGAFMAFFSLSATEHRPIPWAVGIALVAAVFLEWLTANIGWRASTALTRSLFGLLGGAGGVIILYHYGQYISIRIISAALILAASAALVLSAKTAVLVLIICSLFIFWIDAGQVVFHIFSPRNQKGWNDEKQPNPT